jgi:hypothetical protein
MRLLFWLGKLLFRRLYLIIIDNFLFNGVIWINFSWRLSLIFHSLSSYPLRTINLFQWTFNFLLNISQLVVTWLFTLLIHATFCPCIKQFFSHCEPSLLYTLFEIFLYNNYIIYIPHWSHFLIMKFHWIYWVLKLQNVYNSTSNLFLIQWYTHNVLIVLCKLHWSNVVCKGYLR